ncbi:MAG: (2Fe-2S)-binding protein [Chloracidobacterium sp.]|nr:(2Fe-2S)-binding protein [Chloracidobacterium sp.]MCC6825342.1 (2Fe-2S)-binding protein [Acidobacteriota bacterium]MCO5333153.1 (2Fe-2S)-binding protein [Pyrinomonadaceae bacterium]
MEIGTSGPRITAETANGTIAFEAPAGKKLVLAIEDEGIDILHRCGGNARCTTCRVEILSENIGERTDVEKAILATKPDISERIRLSCQLRLNEDLHIRVVNQASIAGIDPGKRPED